MKPMKLAEVREHTGRELTVEEAARYVSPGQSDTVTVMDPERGLLQDGRAAQEFLEELFEYEYCAECGGDTEDHVVVLDVLGLFHAYCLKPPTL